MKLSIIIPSYNTKTVTKQCLDSLFKALQNENLDYEIIVVDNASSDGTIDRIKNLEFKIKNLKAIYNKKNVGYSKANNQGLKIAKGEYILFLNSDVIIEKLQFKRFLNYLDSRPEVGVCTVRVGLTNDSIDPASHRGFPTIWNSFCYFLKLEALLGKLPVIGNIFGGYHLTSLDLRTIHEIDSPSGAFYLSRKKVLNEVGGFDEDYFMYGEDIDLSYRIKERGYRILYYPLFHVTHLKYVSGLGTTDSHIREKIKKHFYDAMKIFYKKHYEKMNPEFVNKLVYAVIDLKARLS